MLKLTNVWHKYGKKLEHQFIFENVDFAFSNKKYVLIGPSGIGKTTLLNIAGGIIKPTSGNVENTFKLGFIFQSFNLLADFTLAENIEMPARIKKIKPQYEELANFTDITHLLNKFPNEVSGGQKQRAAITRALVSGADFIIADEPSANLDKENAQLIINLFDLIHHQLNIGCLISTHDTDWLKIADEELKIEDKKLCKNMNR